MRPRLTAVMIGAVVAVLSLTGVDSQAQIVPIDLNTLSAESFPAVSGFGAGIWTVAGDGQSVFQSVNGQPTFFHSDFDAFFSEFEGVIKVSGGDDDLLNLERRRLIDGLLIGYLTLKPVSR